MLASTVPLLSFYDACAHMTTSTLPSPAVHVLVARQHAGTKHITPLLRLESCNIVSSSVLAAMLRSSTVALGTGHRAFRARRANVVGEAVKQQISSLATLVTCGGEM